MTSRLVSAADASSADALSADALSADALSADASSADALSADASSTDVLTEEDRLTLLQITGVISLSYQVDIWEFLNNLAHQLNLQDKIRHFVNRKTCMKPDLTRYINQYQGALGKCESTTEIAEDLQTALTYYSQNAVLQSASDTEFMSEYHHMIHDIDVVLSRRCLQHLSKVIQGHAPRGVENVMSRSTCTIVRTGQHSMVCRQDLNDQPYNTALVVTHADSEHALVSIKGTTNLDDWWHNLNFKTTDGSNVTRGFDAKANALKGKIMARLEDKKKVLICGHSLGGAVATLITHALNKERSDVETVTVTIGAPRCGKVDFKTAYDGSQVPGRHTTLRLMNFQDPVPTVPLHSMGFRHVGTGVVVRRSGVARHGGLASASEALGRNNDITYGSFFENETRSWIPKLLLNRHGRKAYYESIQGQVKVGS